MKKLLTGLFSLILTMFFSSIANACDIEGLYNNYQAVYLPSTSSWSTGAMADDRIVLTKKTSEGSGNYSEYYYSNGKPAINLNSNFEFIKDGQLIGVDNAGLKYYKISYDKKSKKFIQTLLKEDELQKIFPNAQIIKISQFKNNEITVKKRLFKDKKVLLLNDTERYFHKYSYKPASVQQTDIKGLITLSHIGKVKFSLYGDKNDMLIIKVRKGSECTCGEKCSCGPKCACNKDNKCSCGEKCNCGSECACNKDKKCTCGEKCNCKPECNCNKK